MKAAKLWPLAVVGVLVATVAANGFLLYEAGDSRHAGIEPDYYDKAVAWDSTLAQQARSAALGWRLDAALTPAADGGRLRVRLVEAGGAPLEGATLRVEAIHNTDPDHRVRATLAPAGPGLYQAALPLRHAGLWELRFDVTRGRERFTADVRRDLAPRSARP